MRKAAPEFRPGVLIETTRRVIEAELGESHFGMRFFAMALEDGEDLVAVSRATSARTHCVVGAAVTDNLDRDRSRGLCDQIQAVVEELHAIAPGHSAIALLTKAADEIAAAAMANSPRRYADYTP